MASFSVALRQLNSSCEFGTFLPEALGDQFVCGLSNQGIQRKLLAEANLTLDRALQLARAMSMATENTVDFHTDTLRRDTHTVNKVSKNVQAKTYAKSSSYVCWRCAKPNHSPDVCRFKEAVYHDCKQKNRWAEHFSAVLNRSADINAEAIARLPQVETNTDLDRPPSEEEVKKAIKQLSTGKAPGADAIPADVYKHGGDTLLQKLTDLFCRMWDEEVIPQQLKDASIFASTKREIASFVTTTEESLSWP